MCLARPCSGRKQLRKRFRLSGAHRLSAWLCLFASLLLTSALLPGILSAEDDPSSSYDGGEFDLNAGESSLIRIVSAGFDSSLRASAETLASTFNWRNLPLHSAESAPRALAISTSGPNASLEDLIEGRAELAIVRADLADRMYSYSGENPISGHKELRLVSTHKPILLHIVVREEFNGSTLNDLKGKRINISGKDAATMTQLSSLLNSAGFNADSYEAVYAPESHALTKLESGAVDAVVFFDQAPSRLITSQLENHRFRLIGLPEQKLQTMIDLAETNEQLRNNLTHYQLRNSADFYGDGQTITTFSLTSFLLTRADVSTETIDLIINQLSAGPAIASNSSNDLSSDGSTNTRASTWSSPQEPHLISTEISPIPLHPSSQIFLDIFSDSEFYGLPAAQPVPGTPAAALPGENSLRARGRGVKNKTAGVE